MSRARFNTKTKIVVVGAVAVRLGYPADGGWNGYKRVRKSKGVKKKLAHGVRIRRSIYHIALYLLSYVLLCVYYCVKSISGRSHSKIAIFCFVELLSSSTISYQFG